MIHLWRIKLLKWQKPRVVSGCSGLALYVTWTFSWRWWADCQYFHLFCKSRIKSYKVSK